MTKIEKEVKAPPTDVGRRRLRFGQITFDQITALMNSIGTAWVFVLLVIINLDIGGRALFNHPIRGVPEIVALSIVACVFLQLAHTLKVGRLTRSDILLDWIGRRKPGLRHLLEGIYYLVGAALMAILFNASLPMLSKAWRQGLYVGAEGDFMAPVWPVKLIVLIGCLAAGIQFLLCAWKEFRAIIQPPALPEEKNGGAR